MLKSLLSYAERAIDFFLPPPNGCKLAKLIGTLAYWRLRRHAKTRANHAGFVGPAGFLEEDLVALYLYTHQEIPIFHYKAINSVLRGEPRPNKTALLNVASCIEVALKKLPVCASVPCYRATNFDTATLSNHQIGAVITYHGFTSTSLAKIAISHRQPVAQVIYGKSGREIHRISRFPAEMEVLYPPGTQFRVLSKNQIGAIHYIIMEEV